MPHAKVRNVAPDELDLLFDERPFIWSRFGMHGNERPQHAHRIREIHGLRKQQQTGALCPAGEVLQHELEIIEYMMENPVSPNDIERLRWQVRSLDGRTSKTGAVRDAVQCSGPLRDVDRAGRDVEPGYACSHLCEHHCIGTIT